MNAPRKVSVYAFLREVARRIAEGEVKRTRFICNIIKYDTELTHLEGLCFVHNYLQPHAPLGFDVSNGWWGNEEVDERVLFLLFLSEFYKGKTITMTTP
jgi:hypothetical protein